MNTNIQEKHDHSKFHVQGALTGAFYGLLMGTAFVLVMAYINMWLHPNIPFGVDWPHFGVLWLLIGLGLAAIGAVACLFDEPLIGLLVGAVVAGFLGLGGTLLFSNTTAGMKLIVLIFTLAPMAVVSLPVAWVLQRLVQRHAGSTNLKWRPVFVALLIVIAVALGGGSAYFTKISDSALEAVRLVNEGLRADGEHPGIDVSQLAGWQEHRAMRYELFQQKSEATTEGFDVRAVYQDGYTVKCIVSAYPGYDIYIKECAAAEK